MTNFAGSLIKALTFNTMKKSVGLWVVMIGITLGACRVEQRPADILPPNEMAKIMIDLYLAEARLTDGMVNKDSALRYFIPQQQRLLEKHSLSDSAIVKSFQYYVDHPQQLEKIYESVIDTLNLREQKLRASDEVK